MDDRQTPDKALREMIDAVRPASDDLSRPEFAELAAQTGRDPQLRRVYQRSQRLDLAINEAMHDLPVPQGAVERLLAALDAAAVPASAGLDSQPTGATGPQSTVPVVAVSSERAVVGLPVIDIPASPTGWWPLVKPWAGPAAFAAASSVALLTWFLLRPVTLEMGPEEILTSDWVLSLDEGAAEHQAIDRDAPPAQYPVSPALAVKPSAWRAVSGLLGRKGVAYPLLAGKFRATLYVLDADPGRDAPQLVRLAASPPREPADESHNRAMSVWRSGKLVYLLVVEGGQAEYQAFLRPTGQLARAEKVPASRPLARRLALLPRGVGESS